MHSQNEKYYIRIAWGWIIACSIFRVWYAGMLPLLPDETNYWQWSRHLDWGYHDHPPMIAWAIKLSTSIFGHTEIGVRLPSIISMAVASMYLVLIGQRWFGPKAAFYVSILSQAVPGFNVGALMATTDGIQAAAWAGASYHVACAYEKNQWRQWLLGGFWFGFGMLSKYTMVVFLPGAYLYGILSRKHRKRLAGLRPYTGVLLGIFMFLPVVFWNANNDWNSLRHVAFIGGANQEITLHLNYLGEFIGAQAGIVNPLVFIAILWGWAFALRKRYWEDQWICPYLFFTSFPMFAGFAVLSLHSRVEANWPGTAYLTASVLVVVFFTDTVKQMGEVKRSRRWQLWPWAVGTAYFLTALLLLQVVWPFIPIHPKQDRIARELSGWRALGKKALEIKQTMPNPEKTFLFGIQYQEASELAFYTPGNPYTVSINKWSRPNVYDYWWKDEDLTGWDAVGVTYDNVSHQTLFPQVFERVDAPVALEVPPEFRAWHASSSPASLKVYYLYRAYGFKGGLRWKPTDRSDIRVQLKK